MAKTGKKIDNDEVTVLMSGGIDSTACISLYLDQGLSVKGIFFNYGQPAKKFEEKSAMAVARHYQIPLKKIAIMGSCKKNGGFIKGRNAFLLFAGLMEMETTSRILAIGIHSGTPYIDCSSRFIQKMQSIFDMYTDGVIQIGVPFIKFCKPDIFEYCKRNSVPLKLTYSCELGERQPCGHCQSCKDLEALYVTS